jgi:HD-like signal output (HDOD) protein
MVAEPETPIGQAEALWFGQADDSAAERAARRSKAARMARQHGLLTFQNVARSLVAAVSRPDYDLESVAALLAEDPALASNLLRLANTGLTSAGAGVATVREAVDRVGKPALRDLVLSTALAGAFWQPGPAKQVRDHGACTAGLGRLLARELAPAYVEPAYLTGLLHDLGKLFLLQTGSKRYARQIAGKLDETDGAHLVERRLLGYDHAVLAAVVLAHWGIPEPVPQVVRRHHLPVHAAGQDHLVQLVAILRLADGLERLLRHQPGAVDQHVRGLLGQAEAQVLDLDEAFLRGLWTPLYQTWNDCQRLLG